MSLLTTSEGYRPKAYLDPVNIPTICYGHTGPEVRLGMKATAAQCGEYLQKDLRVAQKGLTRCIKVRLNQNQHDALMDFTLNVGVGNLCSSTLARKVNAGDMAGAALEFPKWKFGTVNGTPKVLKGLVTRRAAEQKLFLTPIR